MEQATTTVPASPALPHLGHADALLWTPRVLLILGVLTNFLASAILAAINLSRLGNRQRVRILAFLLVVAFLLQVGCAVLLPDNLFGTAACFSLNAVLSFAFTVSQVREFEKHLANGGGVASWVRPVIWISS